MAGQRGVTNGKASSNKRDTKYYALAIECARADSQRCTCGKPRWMHYNLLTCLFVLAKVQG
jgi:hypothetical protein